MSATMAATRVTGVMRGEVPPREVAGNVEEAVGLRDELTRSAFEASWIAQHVAYGTAAGVAYALAEDWHPRSIGHSGALLRCASAHTPSRRRRTGCTAFPPVPSGHSQGRRP
jgi:hypothetical protein